MKNFILCVVVGVISIFPVYAVKKVEANPINIAHSIAEMQDTAKIVSTLEYYGYVRQIPREGNVVFNNPNGSEILYAFSENGEQLDYPKVQVFTNASKKEKRTTLTNLRFTKTKNYYERKITGFDKYVMQCHQGSKNSLIFLRKKNRNTIDD